MTVETLSWKMYVTRALCLTETFRVGSTVYLSHPSQPVHRASGVDGLGEFSLKRDYEKEQQKFL